MTENITTYIARTYYDEEKTKLKEEYFVCNGQIKEEINYVDGKKL